MGCTTIAVRVLCSYVSGAARIKRRINNIYKNNTHDNTQEPEGEPESQATLEELGECQVLSPMMCHISCVAACA